ncbi:MULTISPECIES: flagellar brake protein [Pseudoalteromonas]|uniref:Flagellar brake protein n=1 Tax=Pseudoalteromonas amylolytica TaxID=1859457 RepID=A0A1S1MIP3_9GAMM|nr:MULTISPECIES: flagellar brake protein [Pseudoalteromonas]OHU84729.1 hypothetical protein BFC16_00105 [Pseudoalteromonas sp. JW3]OHU86409.1 hypothetical protein BET10_01510 [Pseudoalteromonas amylolytica]
MLKTKSYSGYQKIKLISVGHLIDLEIQLAASSKRVKTEFIGFLEGQYIILNYPNSKQLGRASEHLKEDATVIVRAVADHGDGQIIAFKTEIKAIAYTPTKLLFLYPPQEIQSHCLRHHVRIPTLIPATLMTSRSTCDGVIKDMSRTGLQFSLPSAKVDLPLYEKECQIVIAAKNQQQIRLQGEVCSTVHQGGSALVGIKLVSEENKVESLLRQCMIDLTILHTS